ncbi:MAG: orotate phosphoribosyltransferase [Patescibacteria group bacterium]|jgi:uridine monophosphate synthetase
MNNQELILKLAEINAVKFGEFTLKSGMKSPIYIDLRVIVSYPSVMKTIIAAFKEKIAQDNIQYDLMAGIPYTALPIASVLSIELNTPMIYARKEVKDYGTKKKIEGVYKAGQTCLVIDDLITTGASKFETAAPFESEGLKIKDFVVLVDREQGGKKQLEAKGYQLHSVITLSEVLTVMKTAGKIDEAMCNKVQEFIKNNQI